MSSPQSSVDSSNSLEELALVQSNRTQRHRSLRGANTYHEHHTLQGPRSPPSSTVQEVSTEEVEAGSSRTSRYTDAEEHTWPAFLREHTTSNFVDEDLAEPRPINQTNVEGKRRFTTSAHTPERASTISGGFHWLNESSLAAQLQGSSAGSSRRSTGETVLRAHSPIYRPSITMRRPMSTTQEVVLPRWQPDSAVSECPICSRQFTFWFRKHHCRKCGRVVCAACSPHRITIPRQFIVHPLESTGRAPTDSTSSATIFDAAGEARCSPRADVPPSWTTPRGTAVPGLGGGEEVRLCNPCVPDPQPSPQATMDLAEFLRQGTGRDEVRSPPEQPQLSPSVQGDFHRRSVHGRYSQPGEAREIRRQRGRGMIRQPDNDRLSTMPARADELPDEGLPEYGNLDYAIIPSHGRRDVPPRYQSNHGPMLSPPGYSSPGAASVLSRGQPQDTTPLNGRAGSYVHRPHQNALQAHARYSSMDAMTRPALSMSTRPRVRSMLDADPGSRRFLDALPSSPSSRPFLPSRRSRGERDVCPVCRHALPPPDAHGDETTREAHVMDCIAARDPSAPPLSAGSRRSLAQSPPSAAVRMLTFVASEKDCVGEDGASQECSICFVEYDVGDHLARLECLCKFHKSCIASWFSRKQECPVHKVA